MTPTEASLGALAQLLVLSLIIERVVHVGRTMLVGTALPAQTAEPTWGRWEIFAAFVIAVVVLWSASFDLIAAIFKNSTEIKFKPYLGELIASLVVAGGSSGISKIMEAIAAAAKASKAQSIAKVSQALYVSQLDSNYSGQNASLRRPPVAENETARKIIETCELEWPANSSDCSGFVKDVCSSLGVTVNGNADAIVKTLAGPDWNIIRGSAAKSAGIIAKEAADVGNLVIAGLLSTDHVPRDDGSPVKNGHVVIVVSGPLAQTAYPTAYWGTLGGEGKRFTTLNWAWRKADRDKLTYAWRKL